MTVSTKIIKSEKRKALFRKEELNNLMKCFYRRLVLDKEMKKLFEFAVGEDMELHIAKVSDFWCKVYRIESGYKNKKYIGHESILNKIDERLGSIWMLVFIEVAEELLNENQKEDIVKKAEGLMKGLMFFVNKKREPLSETYAL